MYLQKKTRDDMLMFEEVALWYIFKAREQMSRATGDKNICRRNIHFEVVN